MRVLYNVNAEYIVKYCANMGSQSRRKKKSARKRPRFVEEERNEKRRIGYNIQQQESHENQQNIIITTIEGTQHQRSNILSQILHSHCSTPMQDDVQNMDVLGGEGTSNQGSNNLFNQYISSSSQNQQFQNQGTQMQDRRCDILGQKGASSSRSGLPKHIPTSIPSSIQSQIDAGERVSDRTIRYHTSKMYEEYFSPKSLISQAQLLTGLLQ